jgi:fatty-acyl-CoA synthase
VRLVDDKDNDVEPGEVGRIFAGSGMSFEGYTSGEDKTRLGTLASIGDVGRIGDDGRLYVEGRDDDMIVSGGENVFPAEVEEILHQHSDVADAAVVGIDDEKFGQALVAHVVLRDGASVAADELRKHVKAHLANYKVPREVVFHDELPRNETGKVVKRSLAETADDNDGDHSDQADGGDQADVGDQADGSDQADRGEKAAAEAGRAKQADRGKKAAAKAGGAESKS